MLVDDEKYPWVLEVNMSPGIARRNDRHTQIVQNMCKGMLRLVLSQAGEDVSKLPLSSDSFGRWEPLTIAEKEPIRDVYLDNRNAVIGSAIQTHTLQTIDANFLYREKQLLLQR